MANSEYRLPPHQARQKREFSTGGKKERDGINPYISHRNRLRSEALVASGILPTASIPGEKIIILSPSANRGSGEKRLEELLPDNVILAADIANIVKLSPVEQRVQLNAAHLPFPNASIDAITDMGGAIAYEAMTDQLRHTGGENILSLVAEYRRVLKHNGLFITNAASQTDRSRGVNKSSAELLDEVLGPNYQFPGFAPYFEIGDDLTHMRIYSKMTEEG